MRGVSVDLDLVVLVALTDDAPLPLLDLRRQPWHVEMVERFQAKLRIDACAHRFRRPDQEANLSGAYITEQPLLGLCLFEVLHKGDFRRGNAHADQLVADPAIGGKPSALLDIDRAEIREDHLCGAQQFVRLAIRTNILVLGRLLPDAVGVAHQKIELVVRLVVHCRHHQPQVDRRVTTIGDDRQQNIVSRLCRSITLLYRLDAGFEDPLVGPERLLSVRR